MGLRFLFRNSFSFEMVHHSLVTGTACNLKQIRHEVKSLSRVRLLATPWSAAYHAPPSMGFSRQEYWSGVPLPSPILALQDVKFKNNDDPKDVK